MQVHDIIINKGEWVSMKKLIKYIIAVVLLLVGFGSNTKNVFNIAIANSKEINSITTNDLNYDDYNSTYEEYLDYLAENNLTTGGGINIHHSINLSQYDINFRLHYRYTVYDPYCFVDFTEDLLLNNTETVQFTFEQSVCSFEFEITNPDHLSVVGGRDIGNIRIYVEA